MNDTIYMIAILIIPLIFAITLHEVAHGYVAYKFGDKTAKWLGRLTLNPVKHVDPVGTLLIPGVLMLVHAPFLFGWAKPVPVIERNLKNPKRAMALVALAGPSANLLMALAWAALAKLASLFFVDPLRTVLIHMGGAGISINMVFMILNLLPIPPLDGGRILKSMASYPIANFLEKIEPYGFFILLALIALGIIQQILGPLVSHSVHGILRLFLLA